MNIFEDYLIKIKNTIKRANQDNLLELPENLSGINVDIPPAKFNGDVSTNVAMVLSKINKKPPIELAEIISGLLKKNDKNIDHISIEKPGFINLKFKKEFWSAFILDVLNKPSYGSNLNGKKNSFLVEFVSANQQDHFMLDIQEAQYLVTLFQIYYHLMVTMLPKNTM